MGIVGQQDPKVNQLKHDDQFERHHLPKENQHNSDNQGAHIANHPNHVEDFNIVVGLGVILYRSQDVVSFHFMVVCRKGDSKCFGGGGDFEYESDVLFLYVLIIFDFHVEVVSVGIIDGRFGFDFQVLRLEGCVFGEVLVHLKHML